MPGFRTDADRLPAGRRRSELRAVDTCPPELAPIAELQYRSQWFSHPNNRDWTVRALLSQSRARPWLRIADDADTSEALLLALDRLLDEPRRPTREASARRRLLPRAREPGPGRQPARWLDDPQASDARSTRRSGPRSCSSARRTSGSIRRTDGEITAARKLGERQGSGRRCGSGSRRRPSDTPGSLTSSARLDPTELYRRRHVDAWPQDNEHAEDQLRNRLRDFAALTAGGRPQGGRSPRRRARVATRHRLGRARPGAARVRARAARRRSPS